MRVHYVLSLCRCFCKWYYKSSFKRIRFCLYTFGVRLKMTWNSERIIKTYTTCRTSSLHRERAWLQTDPISYCIILHGGNRHDMGTKGCFCAAGTGGDGSFLITNLCSSSPSSAEGTVRHASLWLCSSRSVSPPFRYPRISITDTRRVLNWNTNFTASVWAITRI